MISSVWARSLNKRSRYDILNLNITFRQTLIELFKKLKNQNSREYLHEEIYSQLNSTAEKFTEAGTCEKAPPWIMCRHNTQFLNIQPIYRGGNVQHMKNVPEFSHGICIVSLRTDHRKISTSSHHNNEIIHELKLAQTGEGIASCELIRWFVKEGDDVAAFQPVCEVQSDKATVEITSRYEGKVSRVHFNPGDLVQVGEVLCNLIGQSESSSLTPGTSDSQSVDSSNSPVDQSELLHPPPPLHAASPPIPSQNEVRTLATPRVRSLAKNLGLPLDQIQGSGLEGRVLEEDVLKFSAHLGFGKGEGNGVLDTTDKEGCTEGKATVELGRSLGDTVIPLRGYRRAMAKSMAAAREVPHFFFLEEVDVGRLLALRDSLREEGKRRQKAGKNEGEEEARGAEVSFLPLLIKMLSQSLLKYPAVNAHVDKSVTELVCRERHNIGVAMDTPHGLVVPNIKNCQSASVWEISKELARLRRLASENQLPTEDVTGGTITLSNIGSIGGTYAGPLIHLPEVAIVAIGRIRKLPRFDLKGDVQPASIVNISWAADHRVVDGATIAKVSQEWKKLIEHPEYLLFNLK